MKKRRRLVKINLLVKEVIIIEGKLLDKVFLTTINSPSWEIKKNLNINFTCDKGTAENYLKEHFNIKADNIITIYSKEK